MSLKVGIYRHYKGGEYKVLCIAKGQFKDRYDMEDMVVYEALENNTLSQYWVRPLSEFTEEVVIDGVRVPRFSFQGV
ncbi:MAG: DUF1653 domain-containing protein [Patescibacteria group bacterium UBA2163]